MVQECGADAGDALVDMIVGHMRIRVVARYLLHVRNRRQPLDLD